MISPHLRTAKQGREDATVHIAMAGGSSEHYGAAGGESAAFGILVAASRRFCAGGSANLCTAAYRRAYFDTIRKWTGK